MNHKNNTIYELIARSFTSELNDKEGFTLDQWKAESEQNNLEYLDLKEIWVTSGRMSLPHQVDIEANLKLTRQRAGIKERKTVWLKYLVQTAAILVLALALDGLYRYFGKADVLPPTEELVLQQVKAAFGTQSRVELPDGSVVDLNSGSTLSFPVSFENKAIRKVQLSGEGFFKVAKNNQQPFIVEANKLEIKVLGTSFNVECYANNPSATVALVEGSVVLQRKTGNQEVEIARMLPNDVAVYKQTGDVVNVTTEKDLHKYTAWKDGKIVFVNDPVQIVIQKLSNWYNVDIELADPRLEKYRFTGTFINEPLEQILSIMNLTSQMSYTIQQAKKLTDNSFSKRKIFLKSK